MNREVINSICGTISDYREGEIEQRTPDHVREWARQFPAEHRDALLAELDHVLKYMYVSKKDVMRFLASLTVNEKLVGDDPEGFWRGSELLDVQDRSNSQHDMLALFGGRLQKKCGISTAECEATNATFIYLDDGIFSGTRVLCDLRDWLDTDAPDEGSVHVIVMAMHAGGQYYARTQLEKKAKELGKNITFTWWRSLEIEDRKYYMSTSDVLRPTAIPDDEAVRGYVAELEAAGYPPILRTGQSRGGKQFFSSHEGRVLLEEQFLVTGAHIRQRCPHLPEKVRPLGYMGLKTLGFGSLLVTYRNCPNNTPPALWAGDPWIPLLPRRINEQKFDWEGFGL